MEICAVISTCACCGKAGHEKARCRFRFAKCSNCGKTGRLRVMCRQRGKSAGKSSPSSSSGKSSGQGGTSRGNTDKCYCCGQVGHRRPLTALVGTRVAVCGKRAHVSHVCRSSGGNVSARAVEAEPMSLRRREKFNTCGHCQFATFPEFLWTFCMYATSPISRLTNLGTCRT